jgi:hypothetical protein
MVSSTTRVLRIVSGIAGAATTLGVAQLLAVPLGPPADAVNAVGSAVIDLTPGSGSSDSESSARSGHDDRDRVYQMQLPR